MTPKPLIVWDFDDVLFPLTEAWFESCGKDIQSMLQTYSQITSNPPHEIMQIKLKTYLDSLDRFRNSEQAQSLVPEKKIKAWFSISGSDYRHQVLTARPLHTLDSARKWLDRYFQGYFEHFGFVPAPRDGHDLQGYYHSKYDYLIGEKIYPDFFIDDKTATIKAVEKIDGNTALLYPRPWNEAWQKPFDLNQLIPGKTND